VTTITREPLAEILQKHILTTARNAENFKVIDQKSRSQDRIVGFFTVARYKAKKLLYTITDILHEHVCTFTTARTLFSLIVIGQRSRSHEFVGVFLCA